MNKTPQYRVLAFYHFAYLSDPHQEIKKHKNFIEGKDITCRVYISEEGINGQLSASEHAACAYIEWIRSKQEFSGMPIKIHQWHEQVFPRQTVKYRKNLVAHDKPVDLSRRGKHVSPKEWKEMIESDREHLVLDIRNDYEWKLGHFKGATLPKCETFREFEEYADTLKTAKDPTSTPVMMYCTGGIRCELYSSILLAKGFTEVYQLDGGIINYGLQEGTEHWLGRLFVFDDRMSVPISDDPAPIIGKCHRCGVPNETYYNCANMDCNNLFLSCKECAKELQGCCRESCLSEGRVRPFSEVNPHKPFRRKSYTPNAIKLGISTAPKPRG